MNKGFSYYFRRSWNMTFFVYKRLGFVKKLELTLFLLVCYLGCSIFFLRPIFSIALMNMSRMIEESHNLSISKCFEGITKNARFKELLIADLYVFFLVLVILTLFFIPNLSYMYRGLPSRFNWVQNTIKYSTIGLGSLIAAVIEIKYFPLSYVASGTINTSAGDMLINVRHIRKGAIFTEILLFIVFGLLAFILIGGCAFGIGYVSNNLMYKDPNWYWLNLGLFFVLIALVFFPMTIFLTMLHVALYELYKDTVSLKRVYIVKELPGTEVGYASIFPTDSDEIDIIKDEKIGGSKK